MKYTLLLLLFIAPIFVFSQSKRAYKKEVKKFRKHYKQEFLEEEQSPFYGKEKAMKKMRFYKPKRSYRFVATVRLTPDAVPFKMATYSGKTKDYVQYGIANVLLNGKKVEVHIYQSLRLREMEEYKNYLFIPFKDLTNSDGTYGGGRYIDLDINDIKDGKVVIDFNKTYNPWCAYSDGYNCPVPPMENHFDVKVKAGEKMFKGKH